MAWRDVTCRCSCCVGCRVRSAGPTAPAGASVMGTRARQSMVSPHSLLTVAHPEVAPIVVVPVPVVVVVVAAVLVAAPLPQVP